MTAASQPVLRIKDLYKRYDQLEVINGLSLDVFRGQVLVVVGPSGCGTSTLLRCINGLEPIQGGDIELNGQSITSGKPRWNLVRPKIGMVFHSYDLFPPMSAMETILLGPLQAPGRVRAAWRIFARPRPQGVHSSVISSECKRLCRDWST